MEKLLRMIEAAQAVSFDMFDTLIVRLYRKPTDLFLHLEESFQLPGFREARIAAEQLARKSASGRSIQEVTLDEIYEEMHKSYQPVKEQEIRLELKMCRADPVMRQVYDAAREQGKPLYICSDMYLPKSVIEKILSNAGYSGYQLLLSSDTKRPKATGEMYEDLALCAGIPPQKILHIGDHPYTDYQMARQKGLAAYLYEPLYRSAGCCKNSSYFAVLNRYADQNLVLSILEGLVVHRKASHPELDYWEDFGYQYVGILAYGYMNWLRERLDHMGITRVYFMMRDGYIMKRVFDKLFPQYATQEIYGSRRMFLFSGMQDYQDIKAHVTATGIQGKDLTYTQFWERLCLEDQQLRARFVARFPEQDQIISTDAQLRELDEFMEQNVELLLREGEEERSVLKSYFQEIHLLDEKAAIVDLGWKGSMLKGIEQACGLLGCPTELTGFYLGTHPCETGHMRIESYLLDHGRSTGASNARLLMDSFVLNVLELAFTAPQPGTLKLARQGEYVVPVYQDISVHEAERIAISQHILDGVLAFTEDLQNVTDGFPLRIRQEAVLAPLEYLAGEISRTDQAQIEAAYVFPGIGNDSRSRPIFRQGGPVIGIINPWPGSISAEIEVVTRLKQAAEGCQIGYVMLDDFGHILDENQCATNQLVDPRDLSFVLTTHYETPKLMDAFYYHTLWNPPEIPLNLDYYTERVANHYIMNEDYLIYDSGGMSNHLRGMLLNCPRTLEGASSLTASFSAQCVLPPNLDNPIMFYCGMNWEKTVHGTNRHEGLFRLLDNTRKVKFFGPDVVENWGGLRPWEGYQCYQYSIPFDGFSILKEINQCGICLVLSSDVHRRAGAATNRTYEACAAGAVIISDENEFMLRYFRDAALFITYNKQNPKDTCAQIMEKYEWILTHKEEALTLAKRAQAIFLEHFTLEKQLDRLVENHPRRTAQIAEDLYAQTTDHKVLATFVLDSETMETAQPLLDRVFRNVHNQIYPNIQLAVAASPAVFGAVQAYCEVHCACAQVVALDLFDKNGVRRLTDGQAIRSLQKRVPHDYYVNTTGDEIWFSDHITSLVRVLEDTQAICAYSGAIVQDCNRFRRINCFDVLDTGHLYQMDQPEVPLLPGQFLFRAEAHGFMPDFLFDCLDGLEHLAYADVCHYRYGGALAFSRRASFCQIQDLTDPRSKVLPQVMQKRFIQDLVRFYLPESGRQAVVYAETPATQLSPAVPSSKRFVGEVLLYLPIKNLFRLRYYRFRMRRLSPESKKYQIFEKKYQLILQKYNSFWG